MGGWMEKGCIHGWMEPVLLGSPHCPPPSRGLPPALPCPGQLLEGSVLSSSHGHTSELFLVSGPGSAGADGASPASQGQTSARPVLRLELLPTPVCCLLGRSRHRGLCSAAPWDLPLDFSTSVGDTALAPGCAIPAGGPLWAPCGCSSGWEVSSSTPRASAASQGQISDFLLSVLSDFLDGSCPTAVFREISSVSRLSHGQIDSLSLLLFPTALVGSFPVCLSVPEAVPFSS